MAKKTEHDKRLQAQAKKIGLKMPDYLCMLADLMDGKITLKQANNPDTILGYFTPSTYKLFAEYRSTVFNGMTKKQALKVLRTKYPRCTEKQFDAVSRL